MWLQNMDSNELQQVLIALDQALYNHQQWHANLIRTLACRLPYDKHDVIPEAHKECRFGQWYYANNLKDLIEYPGFIAMGDSHRRMHELASHLLVNLEKENTVSHLDYDSFANSLERLRLEIYTLKNELQTLLYNRDPLTTASNRITMLPLLREQQDLIKHHFQSCCLAMIDLDNFKVINDQYGHVVGDKVLVAVARCLMKNLRTYDKIFRYGGEEFLLYIQQVNLTEAKEMLERLRKEISLFPIEVGLTKPLYVTISIGLTEFSSHFSVEQLIDHADKALYTAKSAGRNNLEVWKPVEIS